MSASDKVIMYPEGRLALHQTGFDTNTQTLDELIKGDYMRPMSTVIEYISAATDDDAETDVALRESISSKLGLSPLYNNNGYFLVIYKSASIVNFHIFPAKADVPAMTFFYSYINSYLSPALPIGGICDVPLANKQYISCSLRVSGGVKSLRVGGYSESQMTAGTKYTIATLPSEYRCICAPESTNMIWITTLNPNGNYVANIEVNQTSILLSPRVTIPKNTSLLAVCTYI